MSPIQAKALIKTVLTFVILVVVFGAGWKTRDNSAEAQIKSLQAEQAEERLTHATTVLNLQIKIEKLETRYRDTVKEMDARNYEIIKEGEENEKDLLKRIRDGNLRLSIALKNSGSCPVSSIGTATGMVDQTRAELDGASAERIVAITNDGNDAIRKLNACIDRYRAAQLLIDESRQARLD